jgi:hypothetical protein
MLPQIGINTPIGVVSKQPNVSYFAYQLFILHAPASNLHLIALYLLKNFPKLSLTMFRESERMGFIQYGDALKIVGISLGPTEKNRI